MMKQYTQLTLIALGALAFSGCGNQDPLAGQPDYIKNATPGFQKPAPPVASKENMIISSNASHFFFTENVEGQVSITGRILLDNYETDLMVDNLADFDGATFDPATGIFSWVPPRGYVSGSESTRTTFLRVRLNGRQTQTNITATRTEDFPMTISRLERQPTIVKETGFPASAAREGETLRLTIWVKDEDGVNQAGQKPRIFIQSPTNEPRVGDLTPYIRVASEDNPDRDFSDPTMWKFTINVNLQDVDVTKNSGDFYFRVTAVTRFGKMSPTKEYRVAINTDVQHPILSSDSFEAKVGVDMNQDVIVMDPRQEGIVTVEILNPSELPNGFTLNCVQQSGRRWMNVCRASWKLAAAPIEMPATPIGTESTVRIRATNSSPVSLDRYSVNRDFALKFKVVAQ
ncbi:MAG: hypothetical protein KF767_12445 [Bdellovibrionaceae bacterium]|nr:hypothetical protein [Pseudobdellovibrionaceae bacterium]